MNFFYYLEYSTILLLYHCRSAVLTIRESSTSVKSTYFWSNFTEKLLKPNPSCYFHLFSRCDAHYNEHMTESFFLNFVSSSGHQMAKLLRTSNMCQFSISDISWSDIENWHISEMWFHIVHILISHYAYIAKKPLKIFANRKFVWQHC